MFLRSKSRSFSKFFYSPSRPLIPSLHSFQGTLFNWKIPFNKFQSIFSNINNWIRDLYMFLIPLHKKMKFSIKNFFSKCDQIYSFLRNWPHLLKKSLTENFIFRAVYLFIFLFVLHNIYHNVRIFLCDRCLFRFYKRRGKQLLRWLPNF